MDPDDSTRVIGMLTPSDVVSAYAQAYRRVGRAMPRRIEELNVIRQGAESVLEEVVVRYGGALAGKLVREGGFPQGAILVKVGRGEELSVPNGSTRLLPGDVLVILSTRRSAGPIREWLKQQC